MKLRKRLALALFILSILLGACEEDVYTPAAKVPFPVVHCILSAHDTAHYVRLTKTFSGCFDAYEMAQNVDSLYFKSARVFFDLRGMTKDSTIELEPTWEVNRQPGIFPVDSLLLYKTTKRIGSVRLRIEIPEINTTVIGSGYAYGPPALISPKPTGTKILAFFETEPLWIHWGGILYGSNQTIIRLRYENVYENDSEYCILDYKRDTSYFALNSSNYLKYLSVWIKDDPKIVMRKVLGIDIIITAGSYYLRQYLSKKDWGIDVLDKPYSNLYNAYGIIAGIARDTITDYLPNQKFMDSLVNSELTRDLKFVKWLNPNSPEFP